VTDSRARPLSRDLFLAAVGGNLGTLAPWVTDRVAAMLEEEDFEAGDRIYAAGDQPDHFYVVRQGRVEIVRSGKPVETLEGPRAFGMIDALAERLRSHSAYARMPLQLVKIRVDAWLELLEDSFELARMSVLGLARAVSALEERLWASGRQLEPPSPPGLQGQRSLDIVERVAVLMQAPPLRGVGVQPLSDLASASDEVSFAAGARIFERGVRSERVFVVIDGRVEASRVSPPVTWRGGPGAMVCGVVALADESSAWEARAVTDVRALAFGLEDWFDVMEENFEMVRATLGTLAREHERLSEEL